MKKFIAITVLCHAFWLTMSGVCMAQGTDEQSLLDAANGGKGPTIVSLLEKGTSTKVKDNQGRTPLHLAVAGGHQAAAETILQFGADINALDDAKKTSLDAAVAAGHSQLAEFLRSK